MMLGKRVLWAGALTSLGVAAFAHNGATGVVMDRMMGMTAMKDVMAGLAPMMRGEAPFEVRTVQEGAARIMAHSGENMNRLFPQGSLQAASYARPEIWEDWEDFEALSEQLRTYALGLATAAPNGLTAPAPAAAAPDSGAMDHGAMQMESSDAPSLPEGGMMDHSTMQMGATEDPGSSDGGMMDHGNMQMGASAVAAAPEAPATGYTVAELMGMTQPASSPLAAPSAAAEEAIDFSLMAADDAFEMVSQTCSACHALFRTGN